MKLYIWERWTLGLILTTVGLLAGYVSVFHVATWTMQNSPPGTSIVAGLTNAAISELVPVAALIVYRICRRHDRSTKLAVLLIVAAGALSLGAQLAVAKASPSGWVVSAAPMAAFMLLTKLVLSLLTPAYHLVEMPAVPHAVAVLAQPEAAPTPDTDPGTQNPEAQPKMPTIRRQRSRSAKTSTPLPPLLTNERKVAAAVKALGADSSIAKIASEAGVSVSTARRHLPAEMTSAARETEDRAGNDNTLVPA